MKRQRRTLGLLLAWLAVALSVIGAQPKPRPLPEAIASAAPASLHRAGGDWQDLRAGAPVVGSLAWLCADPRHGSGADLVLRLNAENDGLGYDSLDLSERLHSSGNAGGLACVVSQDAVQRLGWSGCTAYSHGCDPWGRPLSDGPNPSKMPGTIRSFVAALAVQAFDAFQPWLRQLSRWASATRVSLRPGRPSPAILGQPGVRAAKPGFRPDFEL